MAIANTGLSLEALEVLKSESIRGLKAIPKRGAEVGGLLCGELTGEPGEAEVQITSAVPVMIEHRFGPTFRLSPSDKDRFRAAMLQGPDTKVVGWYRSHTRAGEAPAEEDRLFTAEFFPDSVSAFLICYPQVQSDIGADLCIWNAGRNETSSRIDLGSFSLLDQALKSGGSEERLPERSLVVAPATNRSAPALPQKPKRTASALVGALTLAVLCASAIVIRDRLATTGNSVEARTVGLGLKVDREDSGLMISWNRQSPEILQASGADFKVVEGTQSRTTKLTARQLQAGALLYANGAAEDAQVELNIHGPAGNFAQSVRLPGSLNSGTPASATPQPLTGTPTPAAVPLVGQKAQPLRVALQPESPEGVIPGPQGTRTARVEPRAFVPPPASSASQRQMVAGLIEPPQLAPAPHSIAANQMPGLSGSNIPQARPGIATVRETGVPSPVAVSNYVPAHAVKMVKPSVNPDSAGSMPHNFAQSSQPHIVEVTVTIDEHGNVTKTGVAGTTGPFAYALVESSLLAARGWHFEPATLGGKAVSSQMNLRFDFASGSR